MENKIKLILSDMDGTLLNKDKQLPKNAISTIQRCLDRGIIFGIASGRQLPSLESYFPDELNKKLLFVAHNGNYARFNNETIYYSALSNELLPEIIHACRSMDQVWAIWCCKDCAYIENDDPLFLEQCHRFYAKVAHVDDLLELDEPPCMLSICALKGSEQHLLPVFEKYKDRLEVVVAEKIWLDIFNLNEGKGHPVQIFQKNNAISSHETMVFGDYFNDISLFECAEYSYAVSNAHPEIIKKANYTAPSSEEGGVITVIEQFLSKED